MPLHTRHFLRALYDTAVAAAQPSRCLTGAFPPVPAGGRLFVVSCGKAGAEMARAAEAFYGNARDAVSGIAITRHGYSGEALSWFRSLEAGHPVPDQSSIHAADEAIALVSTATPVDRVLILLSGGASALCVAPADGITLGEKQELTRSLLRSGAPISEMNCVRKHVSRFKGGRLQAYAPDVPFVTLAISDVPGDAPDGIGSGPTVPDPTTLSDACAIISKYGIVPPLSIASALARKENETPKPGDSIFKHSTFQVIASGRDSLDAAGDLARGVGYEAILLGDAIEGEARDVAIAHADLAKRCRADNRRAVILSGGELTVTVTGNGQGGPNQEYALALAIALEETPLISAIAGDTDGTDGGRGAASDPAGAFVDDATLARARSAGLMPAAYLHNNDSTGFFRKIGDLLVCGPTGTNVNDFRAIVVDNPMTI